MHHYHEQGAAFKKYGGTCGSRGIEIPRIFQSAIPENIYLPRIGLEIG
jgi:hypothetical protein